MIYSDSNPVFTKTAFIREFKIGRIGMIRIERSQIESARIVPEVWKRSFVVAVDPDRKLLRANSVDTIQLDYEQATISCHLREWEGFA